MEVTPRDVVICQNDDGSEPFSEWLGTLDPQVEARIISRLDRVEIGLLGDVNNLGDGVYEFVLDFGPGYRIYFGQIGSEIHLIRGGSKRGQQRDIDAAKKFWSNHA